MEAPQQLVQVLSSRGQLERRRIPPGIVPKVVPPEAGREAPEAEAGGAVEVSGEEAGAG